MYTLPLQEVKAELQYRKDNYWIKATITIPPAEQSVMSFKSELFYINVTGARKVKCLKKYKFLAWLGVRELCAMRTAGSPPLLYEELTDLAFGCQQ